jgi:energy-coupling factor transporter ATP-binding protein EcfA2
VQPIASYSLLGFTGRGTPPLGWFDLRIEAGVHALYGQNGAGKTTILTALRRPLAREGYSLRHQESSGVFIQVHDWDAPFGESLRDAIMSYIIEQIGHWYGTAQYMLEELWHAETESNLEVRDLIRRFVVAISQPEDEEGEALPSDLIAAAVREGLLYLTPGPRGSLNVWLAASRSHPQIIEAWDLMAAGWPTPADDTAILKGLATRRVSATPPSQRRAALVDELVRSLTELHAEEEVAERVAEFTSEQVDSALEALWRPYQLDTSLPQRLWDTIAAWMSGSSETRPPLLPIPLWKLGTLTDEWVLPTALDLRDEESLVKQHLMHLSIHAKTPGRLISAVDDEQVVFDDGILQEHETLVGVANSIFESLLQGAPRLVADLRDPNRWAFASPLTWAAYDRPSNRTVPLAALSSAQRKWATFAIAAALAIRDTESVDRAGVLIIDEPETALHPAAARHLVEGLRQLAGRTGLPIVVATHSPAFLNDPGVMLHLVSRDSGGRCVLQPLPAPTAEIPERLGISQADLLQLHRIFVIVEGEHDRAVLEEAIGDDLNASRAKVLVMRGANALKSVPDAHLIVDHTDAALLVVVDNVRQGRILPLIEEAIATQREHGKRRATRVLVDGKEARDLEPEERLLLEMFQRALERDVIDRLTFVGLSVGDVIELLPVHTLVPSPPTDGWVGLRQQWEDAGGHRAGNFKSWLSDTHQARVSTSTIRAAAKRMDAIPEDLDRVRTACLVLGPAPGLRPTESAPPPTPSS